MADTESNRSLLVSEWSHLSTCQDTIGWTNGNSKCCSDGSTAADGCEQSGWTCDGYVRQGWCINGESQPSKTHGYAFGPKFNNPTENCCECRDGREPSGYVAYWDKNAYYPYGAVDIDGADVPEGLSVEQCQQRCSADSNCDCVTYQRSSGKCYQRKECVPSGWTSNYNKGYAVYMKEGGSQRPPFSPISPNPQPAYVNMGNGPCVGNYRAVWSAHECILAADVLWTPCHRGGWDTFIQAINEPSYPNGCMLAANGCELHFNPAGAGSNCPAGSPCQVGCVPK